MADEIETENVSLFRQTPVVVAIIGVVGVIIGVVGTFGVEIYKGRRVDNPSSSVKPPTSIEAASVPSPTSKPDGPSPIRDSKYFIAGSPYPKSIGGVQIGMPYSAVVAMKLDKAKDRGVFYFYHPSGGPFDGVNLDFEYDKSDPKVTKLTCYLQSDNASSKADLVNDCLRAFGTETLKSARMGARMEWPNAMGFHVMIIDGMYMLQKKEEPMFTSPHG